MATTNIMTQSLDKDIIEYVEFMKSHMVNKKLNPDAIITHTLMGPLATGISGAQFKGAYSITGLDYEKFMNMYKKIISKDLLKLHIVERPSYYGPVVVDIDFKTTHKERQYLDKHISYITSVFNNLFLEHLSIDKKLIKAFVFEKPEPTHEPSKNLYKDGFHIIYPEIPMDVPKRYFFFDKAKQQIVSDDGFQDIPHSNTYDEILDVSVINNNGILMYGSHKEGRDPYSLTKIYQHNMKIDKTDNYDTEELVSVLSLRRFSEEDNTEFKKKYHSDKFIDEFNSIVEKYMSKKKSKVVDEDVMEKVIEKVEKEYIAYKPSNSSDTEMAKKFAKLLSVKRATEFNDWVRVCWALHSINPNELLPTFIEFSKKSKTNFDKAKCIEIWESAYIGTYTISTIQWWAKQDNPEEYAKIVREQVRGLINKADSGTHDDIANIVKEMYEHIYVCVSIPKNIWYEFQGHRWVAVEAGYTLQNKISDELTKEFFIYNSYLFAECAEKEGIDRDECLKRSQKVNKICDKLKTTGFIESVIKACARKFYQKKFEESLDTKPHLIGFDNGIYDLDNGYFRAGAPDDLVSMSVGYDYKVFDPKDPTIIKIQEYFKTVQKEVEIRDYVLRLCSSFLDGYMKDQKLMVWTGSGCHAAGEEIIMFDKSIRKVQDIRLGDKVMGDDGRERHVCATYTGKRVIYNIAPYCLKDNHKESSIKVTGNHRLALRCHYQPNISTTYDDTCDKIIYWVNYHEYLELGPVSVSVHFTDMMVATKYLQDLDCNPSVIKYGDIIPVTVDRYMQTDRMISKNYCLVKTAFDFENMTTPNGSNYMSMNYDMTFIIQPMLDIQKFYGFEIDGNKRYILKNRIISYNSNGKSTTIDLVNMTLGDYGGMLPTTILTRKQGSSSGATPELADKRGKRFLVIQEPDGSDIIYVSLMKQFTSGNDPIQARALYGNPFVYKPQFKMILTCNVLPNIPSTDGGTWRRLRVTPWDTEFVDGKPKEAHQHKKDPGLIEEMKKWCPAFIWMLLNIYYPKYKKLPEEGGGLQEPPQVTKYTNMYKKDSDVYLEFLDQHVEKSDNQTDTEQLNLLYGMFKGWYMEAYNSKSIPPRKEFQAYLTKAGFVIIKNVINGIRMIDPDKS